MNSVPTDPTATINHHGPFRMTLTELTGNAKLSVPLEYVAASCKARDALRHNPTTQLPMTETDPPTASHGKTSSGFPTVTFGDTYGDDCSLEASSDAVWLGLMETGYRSRNTSQMHLDRGAVAALVGWLQCWLDNGVFRTQD